MHCLSVFWLFLLAWVAFGAQAALSPIQDQHPQCSAIINKQQQEMLAELNLARTQPMSYAQIVADKFSNLGADGLYRSSGKLYKIQEGRAVIEETLAFLKQVKPVMPLSLSRCLSLSALYHVQDQSKTGAVGHQGKDGSQATERAQKFLVGVLPYCGENISYGPQNVRDIVIQLLIDDGVSGRGHRKNVFDPRYRTIGLASGTHRVYGYMSVHVLCLNPLQN
ncbi:Cysteine-rich secretory protein family protein [Azomonas agilis]|uniref:Cysteine-rich secretory protein family protein n=1 Tax=Azomonas agilis TaxID=116849 RepID=A0A562I1L9_9GAMM|nr:Cysteine-rich secretory protein family protein [Azomonas agilis]